MTPGQQITIVLTALIAAAMVMRWYHEATAPPVPAEQAQVFRRRVYLFSPVVLVAVTGILALATLTD